jgi:hypothetical protein
MHSRNMDNRSPLVLSETVSTDAQACLDLLRSEKALIEEQRNLLQERERLLQRRQTLLAQLATDGQKLIDLLERANGEKRP